MKVLITGGVGFIGAHVCALLRARGHEATAFDNGKAIAPTWLQDCRRRHAGVRLIGGDILDATRLTEALDESSPDVVINLAAKPGVSEAESSPEDYRAVNVRGVEVLLDACARAGVGRIVHASSSSVYGERGGMITEGERPSPVGVYGRTKLDGEKVIQTACERHGLSARILRPFTVIGPLGRPDMAAWKFAHAIVQGRPVGLHAHTRRDFTSVHDVAAAFVAAAEQPWEGCETLNIGSGTPHETAMLAEMIASSLGLALHAHSLERPRYLPLSTWSDSSLAARTLAWRPQMTFENSVQEFAQWYLLQSAYES